MSLENFIESLDNVPPELHRNFTLMTDLDRRTKQVMKRINECTREYENADKKSARVAIKKETDELFEKLASFADDKIELALITYELIDKKIANLSSLAPEAGAESETKLFGFDMPLDSNEPTFCNCRGVSHGEMIACDNKECQIEWFHYVCVGLRTAPKGKWYCGTCYEKVIKKQKSRSRRRR